MNQMKVIFCFDIEDFFSPEERPLMLETVLFCPVLRWMGDQMKAKGVKRFFVLCPPEYAAEAGACFDPEDDVIVSGDKAEVLQFLREDGPVAVFPCAQLPLELADGESFAYTTPAEILRESWSGESADGVPGAERIEGWTAVYRRTLSETVLACRDILLR